MTLKEYLDNVWKNHSFLKALEKRAWTSSEIRFFGYGG